MSPAVGRGPGGAGGLGRSQWDGERASKGTRGRNLRGLLGLLRPYRARAAATVIALLIGTAATLAPPLLVKVAIDQGITQHDSKVLVLVVIAFLFSALLVWVMTYLQTYLVGWVGQRALADLRIRIFKHLQSLPIGFYESRPAGVLISRMTNDIEALDSLVTDSVVTLFQSGLTLLGTIGILIILDPTLALITFGIFPFVVAGSIWFRLVSTGAFRRTRETIGAITAYLQETLSGIRVVRSFGQEPYHEARFAELNAENRDANMVTVRLNAAYFPAVEMLSGVAVAVIILYGGLQAIEGHVTAGTVVAFVAALSNLFEPIQQLSQLYTTYQSGMAALEKIFQLLDVRPDLTDSPDAIELPRIDGSVSFEDISFAYAPVRGRARRPPTARPPGSTGRPPLPTGPATACPRSIHRVPSQVDPRSRPCSRLTTSASTSPPVRPLPSSAPPAPASPRWQSSWPASTTPPKGACWWTGTTCATSQAPPCALSLESCPRRHSCSPEPSGRTSPSAAPMQPTSRSMRRPQRWASRSSSQNSITVTTPTWVSAAPNCPPASAS